MTPEPRPTLRDLLAFYLEAGVDCALAEEPINRMVEEPASAHDAPARTDALPNARPAARPAAPRQSPSLSASGLAPGLPPGLAPNLTPNPDAAIVSAREAARSAPDLATLRALLEAFDGCSLKATASRLVFADGNPQARVMFVGEAPGRDEDIEGLPFVGRSGKLLDLMIKAIGLDRSSAYIANVIPWRPPGNRDPSPQETQICLPFIRRQIELVDPDVLVCLGKPSSHAIFETTDSITKMRGKWRDYDTGARTIRAMATFHPAYLLRQPIYKRFAWQDLRSIAAALALKRND